MKQAKLILLSTVVLALLFFTVHRLMASEGASESPRTYEYVTLRWAGLDNTHIIRPNGQVEFVAVQLSKIQKPNRTDSRSFYLNILMNSLAKEGYEFCGISSDDIVMKRPAAR